MRPDLAAIEDDDDRYIARQVYLKKIEKFLNILADIEKEKPRLYALTEMNISERREMRLRTPYLFFWISFRRISLFQLEILW